MDGIHREKGELYICINVCLDDEKYKITKIFHAPIIRQNEYQKALLFLVRMEQNTMLPVE